MYHRPIDPDDDVLAKWLTPVAIYRWFKRKAEKKQRLQKITQENLPEWLKDKKGK